MEVKTTMELLTTTTKDKTPCIYAIINNENRRVYIGESKQPINRFYQHLRTLKNGTHANKELQKDYNKGNSFIFKRLREYKEGDEETIRYYELLYMDIFREQGIELYNSETIEQVKSLLKYESKEWKIHCLMERKRNDYYRKYFGVTYCQFITYDMLSRKNGSGDYFKNNISMFYEKRKKETEREEKEKRKKFLNEHKKISLFVKNDVFESLKAITDNPEEYITKVIENIVERGV